MPQRIKENASLLIVLMGSLGDVVRGLALPAQIKKVYPKATITWLVEPLCRPMVEGHPFIDRLIVFERSKGVSALFQLYRDLKQQRFDIVLDLQRHLKSGLFSLLAAAPRRIGFNRKDAKELNWFFSTETIPELVTNSAKLTAYLKFLEALAITPERALQFYLPQTVATAEVQQLVNHDKKKYIAFVLGSSWKTKDWPAEGYQALAERVLKTNREKIVLLGTKDQSEVAQALISKLKSEKVISLVGKTSIPELVAVLAQAQAAVGPDSGPAHIAGAVGTPYVTLFGPTSSAIVAPYGNEHNSISAVVGCSPCYRRSCPGLSTICMRLISPAQVFARLEAYITSR